jgi:hypothetical protein
MPLKQPVTQINKQLTTKICTARSGRSWMDIMEDRRDAELQFKAGGKNNDGQLAMRGR